MTRALATDLFTNGERFGDLATWRADAVSLHERGPVHLVEAPGSEPFWAVIGNAEVREIEADVARFTNGPDPIHFPGRRGPWSTAGLETLIHMDPPGHTAHRRVTADWFKPSALAAWQERIEGIVDTALDVTLGRDRCDFATEIAVPVPLRVILEIFGLPEHDLAGVLAFTQAMFGTGDHASPPPQLPPGRPFDAARRFIELTLDRRRDPTGDLASAIANGTIDGAPLGDVETLSYYVIILTAGHETTSSAMAGGLDALLSHPDQLAALRRDPTFIPTAVEEMLRWTTPVRHFMRTCRDDVEIAGSHIRRGDWVHLSYPAANVDPRRFDDPLRFDVTRPEADRHVSFDHGRHHCLGAALARMELVALFERLLERLSGIERDGPARTDRTTFVGGLSSLPIRYQLTAS